MKNIGMESLLFGWMVCCGNVSAGAIEKSKTIIDNDFKKLSSCVEYARGYILGEKQWVLHIPISEGNKNASANILSNSEAAILRDHLTKIGEATIEKIQREVEYHKIKEINSGKHPEILLHALLLCISDYYKEKIVNILNMRYAYFPKKITYQFFNDCFFSKLENIQNELKEIQGTLKKILKTDGTVDIAQFETAVNFSGAKEWVKDCIDYYKNINIDDLALKEKTAQPETEKPLLKEPHPEVPAPAASSNSRKNEVKQEQNNKNGGIVIKVTSDNDMSTPEENLTRKTSALEVWDKIRQDLDKLEEEMKKLKSGNPA